ncbi:MAG: exo-alpha-sialidase [Candidatus Hydrogenedentales bacterium]
MIHRELLLSVCHVVSKRASVPFWGFGRILAAIGIMGVAVPVSDAQYAFENPVQHFAANSIYGSSTATNGAGAWVIVWGSSANVLGSGTDVDVFFCRSTDDGVTWSEPALLLSDMTADSIDEMYPSIAFGNGAWVVAWHGGNIQAARSTDDGVSWSGRVQVNSQSGSDTLFAAYAKTATDGHGTWVVCWYFLEHIGGLSVKGGMHASVSTNNGVSWGTRAVLQADAITSTEFPVLTDALVFSGAGTWIAAWGSNNTLGGTIGADPDILYSVGTNNGTSWSLPSALSHTASGDGEDSYPTLASDGSGNVILVWQSLATHDLETDTSSDLFAVRSSNYGSTWSPMTLVTAGELANTAHEYPSIATDKRGNWMIQASRSGPPPEGGTILYHRVAALTSTNTGQTWVSSSDVTPYLPSSAYPVDLTAGRNGTWLGMYAVAADLGGRHVYSILSRYDWHSASDDNDGDGITNEVESSEDQDGDGTSNFADDDADGDWVPDVSEGLTDGDSDGLPSFLDRDSDNDGFEDGVEVEMGTNPNDPLDMPDLPLRGLPVSILLLGIAGCLVVRRHRIGARGRMKSSIAKPLG